MLFSILGPSSLRVVVEKKNSSAPPLSSPVAFGASHLKIFEIEKIIFLALKLAM